MSGFSIRPAFLSELTFVHERQPLELHERAFFRAHVLEVVEHEAIRDGLPGGRSGLSHHQRAGHRVGDVEHPWLVDCCKLVLLAQLDLGTSRDRTDSLAALPVSYRASLLQFTMRFEVKPLGLRNCARSHALPANRIAFGSSTWQHYFQRSDEKNTRASTVPSHDLSLALL